LVFIKSVKMRSRTKAPTLFSINSEQPSLPDRGTKSFKDAQRYQRSMTKRKLDDKTSAKNSLPAPPLPSQSFPLKDLAFRILKTVKSMRAKFSFCAYFQNTQTIHINSRTYIFKPLFGLQKIFALSPVEHI